VSSKDASVPADLSALTSRWKAAGRPAQSGIAWPRDAWTAYFPNQAAVFDRLPDRLTRDDVREHASNASKSDAFALEAFLASMAWGYGNVGYGPWRTERVLRLNPDASAMLRQAAEHLSTAGAVPAYRFLANSGRLKYLGPAFGTKFLHFAPQSPTGSPALILDAIVTRAVRSVSGVLLSATTWNTLTYERYLTTITGWASGLGIEAADAEMLLFVGESPGQWAETWVNC